MRREIFARFASYLNYFLCAAKLTFQIGTLNFRLLRKLRFPPLLGVLEFQGEIRKLPFGELKTVKVTSSVLDNGLILIKNTARALFRSTCCIERSLMHLQC